MKISPEAEVPDSLYSSFEYKLVRSCLENDEEAQNKLFKHYYQPLYDYWLNKTEDKLMTEAILQEGFIKVFQKLHTLSYKKSLEKWIWVIMRNVKNSMDRCAKRENPLPSPEEILFDEMSIENDFTDFPLVPECSSIQDGPYEKDPSYSPVRSIEEIRDRVFEVFLCGLSKTYQEIVELHILNEMPHGEIAQELGISKEAARTRYCRALVELRKQIMNENCEEK
jgi:RNA polymerase sigma factor (sigma-70 family)